MVEASGDEAGKDENMVRSKKQQTQFKSGRAEFQERSFCFVNKIDKNMKHQRDLKN